jgi:hypothetical protein
VNLPLAVLVAWVGASPSGGMAPEVGGTALERVEALAARYGIVLVDGPAWSEDLVTEVEAGLEALPERLRRPPRRLELALRGEPSAFGMGEPEVGRPLWSDRADRFFLYHYREPDEPRALYRLERLTAKARERLWRRRAVVHAVVHLWDREQGWSRSERWRQLTGWLRPLERPLSFRERPLHTYRWAFSRALGQRSPALDLATFVEEALVPPSALMADAVPVDDGLECQEFTKLRFLKERLSGLGVAWVADPGGCPAFERWAAMDDLQHFEVLFSAPSGERVESLFGHLLLRPVYGPERSSRGPSLQPVLEIAALTGVAEDRLAYLVKGTVGGFRNVFATTSLAAVLGHTAHRDQRILRRFRLHLHPDESRRLQERIWELERRGYLPYIFFTDNCASHLVFLLNGALREGRRIAAPGWLWTLPTATLDAIAELRVDEGGRQVPLLTAEPDPFLPTRAMALQAEPRAAVGFATLVAQSPAVLRPRWDRLRAEVRSPSPGRRRAAYRGLESLALRTAREAPQLVPAVRMLVEDLVALERYAADQAESERRRVDRQRMIAPGALEVPTDEELVAERQRQFEREDPSRRATGELRRYVRIMEALESAPRRPPRSDERHRLALSAHTRAAFFELTKVQGDLLERLGEEPGNGPALIGSEPAHAPSLLAGAPFASMAHPPDSAHWVIQESGYRRLAVGAGMLHRGSLTPLAVVRTAMLAELLGEARARGFAPSTEVRLLDTELQLTLREGRPELSRTAVEVARFRTLPREPALTRRLAIDHLGWGGGVAYVRTVPHALPHVGRAHAALYVPLGSARALLGLGAAGQLGYGPNGARAELGPRFELSVWQPLGPNSVRLEAAVEPRRGLLDSRTELDAAARLEAQLALGELVWLTPFVEVRRTPNAPSPQVAAALMAEWR